MMIQRQTYRAAPGGFSPSQWVVVSNAPCAAAIRFFDTKAAADQEADRLNRPTWRTAKSSDLAFPACAPYA
jgi:hypothetical protein